MELCEYQKWSIQQVWNNIKEKAKKSQVKKEKSSEKSRGQLVLPYVEKMTETLGRVFRKHGFSVVCRPVCTLRRLLVHPKDKVNEENVVGCVYKVPCGSCKHCYIGETGRKFGTRLKEHRREVEVHGQRVFTRAEKIKAEVEEHKSAITNHAVRNNHVIDWDAAKVIDKEDNRERRVIKEAIWIKKSGPVMNRDDGAYQLSSIYTQLLVATTSSGHSDEVNRMS